MQNNYFEKYFCCPECKSDLDFNDDGLICSKCFKKYEIKEGIPILVELDSLTDQLRNQIKYFEEESITKEDLFIYEWQKSYLRRFQENFDNSAGSLIVDCGTGSGYMAVELAKRGALVLACDLTLKSLIRLKKIAEKNNLADKIICFCCSAENIPLKNNLVDYFISNAVLEHLSNEKQAVNEIFRVCRESAGLMITVPIKYIYLNPLLTALNYVYDKRIGHLRRYDEKMMADRFKNWNLVKVYFTGHSLKAFKTLFNKFFKIFNEEKIELDDKKNNHRKWFSSNLICFFKR